MVNKTKTRKESFKVKKLAELIVNKRHIVLTVFILFSIISVFLASKVTINNDIAKYLPNTSETRIGMDIMEENFKEIKESTFQIMFKDLQSEEKEEIYQQLEEVEGVSTVDYDETEDYNKEDYTRYAIHVEDTKDSETATKVYEEITKKYEDYEIETNGDIAEQNTEVLPTWIVGLAVGCVLIILIIMCESYVEPFLFLIAILVAILLNNGTNIIFGSVSNITSSISAILQLALSMDYSIMLMNRYAQEKQKEPDKTKAMKNALSNAFTSISSSSLTTIVGLITLVFMSFKIGRDLGFVLAKGVLFSLISIFFVLPALILLFDKLIVKTQKRTPHLTLEKLGKFSYKIRPIAIFLFLGAFIISFFLKGNLGILYTSSEEDKISEIFGTNNQIAIIYKTKDEEAISKHLKGIEEKEKVEQVLGYGNTINEKLTYNQLQDKLQDFDVDVTIEDYLLKILYYNYYNQEENNTMTFDELVSFIKTEVYNNPKIKEELDEPTKDNIEKLANFTSEAKINQKRSANEIANILGIEKDKMNDLFIYYHSKNTKVTIDLDEFIRFMNQDVLTNQKYAKSVDANSRESLNKLAKFVNKNTITKKMNSKEMAQLFGMNEATMKDLYTYYISVNGIDTKISISEFANFVLSDVLTNSQYASSFNEETINNIKMLATFSNQTTITKKMNASELANLFGMDENAIKQLMLLKMGKSDNGTTLSIADFINQTIYIKNNTTYLNNVDISQLEKLAPFAQNQNNINITKMNQQALATIFDQVARSRFC